MNGIIRALKNSYAEWIDSHGFVHQSIAIGDNKLTILKKNEVILTIFELLWRKPMKTKFLISLFLILGLLAACAEMDPHPMDMSQAVQNAETKADHEALAEHYEEAAKEMQLKVDEHKKLLGQYESKSYLYGKQAEDLKAHCRRLIDVYEKAAEENLEMAKMHRQI